MATTKATKVDYTAEAAASLETCKQFLQGCVDFLNDKASLPNPQGIAAVIFHPRAISEAEVLPEALGLPLPAVKVNLGGHFRYFDPWYFAAVRLLELPAGIINLRLSKRSEYSYAAYGRENHYLTRIIANTPWWADTKFGHHAEKSYRDYRRATLRWESKDIVKALGFETRAHSRQREHAIASAVALFRDQVVAHFGRSATRRRKLEQLSINQLQYEALLKASFDIADAVHEKILSRREN